jgi:hypothetical protein
VAVSVAAAGGGGGGGGGSGVSVAAAPGAAPGSAGGCVAGGAAAGLVAVGTDVFVGGKVGVKVGRSPRVGSGVITDTCAGWGEPKSARPTQYPPTSAATMVAPIIAQRAQGRLAGSGPPFSMLMPLSPSILPLISLANTNAAATALVNSTSLTD